MEYSLAFAPLISIPLLIVAGLAALIVAGLMVAQGLRGAWLRLLALGLLVLALAGPSLIREERERLKTVVALVVDGSESQSLADRAAQTETAKTEMAQRLGSLEDFELRIVDVGPAYQSGVDDVSTALVTAAQAALEDVPPSRIGGIVMVTDGQVHDIPEQAEDFSLGGSFPVHALITGHGEERDRRIILKQAPRFGIVGESQQLTYRIEDSGALDTDTQSDRVQVDVRINGEVVAQETAPVGQDVEFFFDVPNSGKVVMELAVEALDGELTDINNRVVTELDGIRENLRVLLVSGEPHAGERTWRSLLKSDASVDLVHFTILRPPQKQDGTPIEELSLIAFPTRELFVEKIDEFDLIIFDRYRRRGVLPGLYFSYMADYVRAGGAMLLATGPEFAGLRSIASTDLQDILPALPTGDVSEEPYRAMITQAGQRHPVTRRLSGANRTVDDEPSWGRWFRLIEAGPVEGDTLMSEGQGRPVLALRRAEEGRVGLFLSDHPWLWARDFDGGGPHAQLLRRLAHWLMKEPDLEEEALTATMEGADLVIDRQTMADAAGPVIIREPDGSTRTVELTQSADGRWQYRIDEPKLGLYQITEGDLRALIHAGPQNAREFEEILSTADIVYPLTEARGGASLRLAANADDALALPRIVPVRQGTRATGPGWIGLERTEASRLTGLTRLPLFAGFLGLALVLAALSVLWYREGR